MSLSHETGDGRVRDLSPIVGNRVSRRELARQFKCCEDSIDNLAKKYDIPFIKVLNERYYDMAEFRARIEASIRNPAPRKRGRPPKVAVA
jgi:hypothetical protein